MGNIVTLLWIFRHRWDTNSRSVANMNLIFFIFKITLPWPPWDLGVPWVLRPLIYFFFNIIFLISKNNHDILDQVRIFYLKHMSLRGLRAVSIAFNTFPKKGLAKKYSFLLEYSHETNGHWPLNFNKFETFQIPESPHCQGGSGNRCVDRWFGGCSCEVA